MADITVMVLDDHEVVRRGICDILERAEGISVVAEAGTVAQAVRRAQAVRPMVPRKRSPVCCSAATRSSQKLLPLALR